MHLSKANASSQSLSVSPIIINVPLSPDKTYTKEITLHNITDNPLPLRASLNDFQTTGEEGDYLFTETKNNPLLSWISLPETEFILDPQETKTIEMTITTPKEIPLGGYYGMLFFELVPQNVTTTATRVVPKVGVLLLANIGTPDAKQAEIATFSIPTFLQDNNLPLLLRVKNTSLHFFTAKPILKLTPLLPIPAPQSPAERNEVVYLEEKIVFQGKIRRWEETINLSRYQP
ncbi:MAG TPA: hypothetical protein VLF20_06090, partial [Patescibacteria group bacterium]|nr:hypothetical protein [Patescibacteria group bacterium]